MTTLFGILILIALLALPAFLDTSTPARHWLDSLRKRSHQ